MKTLWVIALLLFTIMDVQVRTENVLKLSADDQKQLDLINDRLAQMKPQLEQAKKQQEQAQSMLNEANSFINQYNTVDAARVAFLFRIAADVCHCETKDIEFSTDGKSVIKKERK